MVYSEDALDVRSLTEDKKILKKVRALVAFARWSFGRCWAYLSSSRVSSTMDITRAASKLFMLTTKDADLIFFFGTKK